VYTFDTLLVFLYTYVFINVVCSFHMSYSLGFSSGYNEKQNWKAIVIMNLLILYYYAIILSY